MASQVFDDKSTFTEWFGESLGKATDSKAEDEWLETEKRVVVIHRLHQILEPFMLRRQVEDVESKLPPKVILKIIDFVFPSDELIKILLQQKENLLFRIAKLKP